MILSLDFGSFLLTDLISELFLHFLLQLGFTFHDFLLENLLP